MGYRLINESGSHLVNQPGRRSRQGESFDDLETITGIKKRTGCLIRTAAEGTRAGSRRVYARCYLGHHPSDRRVGGQREGEIYIVKVVAKDDAKDDSENNNDKKEEWRRDTSPDVSGMEALGLRSQQAREAAGKQEKIRLEMDTRLKRRRRRRRGERERGSSKGT